MLKIQNQESKKISLILLVVEIDRNTLNIAKIDWILKVQFWPLIMMFKAWKRLYLKGLGNALGSVYQKKVATKMDF